MTTKTQHLTSHELNQFTGTTKYFNHATKSLVYTEGVQYMGERGAYWIIDLIASYQTPVRLEEIPFQAWKIKRTPEGGFVAIMTDGNYNEYVRQTGEYTDLKIDIELFCIADPIHKAVLLLVSEY